MKTKQLTIAALLAVTMLVSPLQAGSDEDSILKSRSTALTNSLLPTVVLTGSGIALMAYASDGNGRDVAGWAGFWMTMTGMIFTPSLGHLYAERPKPFSGAAIRLGLGVVWASAVIAVALGGLSENGASDNDNDAVIALGVASGGIMASAIYDIVTAPRSADQFNKRVESFAVDLAPVYYSQQKAPGLALRLRF
jgi:hypothetical protein